MEELIINKWKELVFENPNLNPVEIFNKVQEELNISYSDVINAISKTVDKKLSVSRTEKSEIIDINKNTISNLEKEKKTVPFSQNSISIMKFLNNLDYNNYMPNIDNNLLKQQKDKSRLLKVLRCKNGYTKSEVAEKAGISLSDITLYENNKISISDKIYKRLIDFYNSSDKISLFDLKEKASAKLNNDEYELFNELLTKLINKD